MNNKKLLALLTGLAFCGALFAAPAKGGLGMVDHHHHHRHHHGHWLPPPPPPPRPWYCPPPPPPPPPPPRPWHGW